MRLLGFVAVVTIALIVTTFLREPPGQRTGSVVFYVFFGVLLFLLVRFEHAKDLFFGLVAAYCKFTCWLLLMVAPLAFFRWLSAVMLETTPLWAQVVLLATWGTLLGGAVAVIATKERRDGIFEPLAQNSIVLPAAYSFLVLMLAVLFFSTLSFVLFKQQLLTFRTTTTAVTAVVTPGRLSDFFLWHFLNAVPVLRITDTIKFAEPLAYETAPVGWILLIFKITVITPLIAAFAWYGKRSRPTADLV